MMPDSFCAFILTHGRPDNVRTFQSLKKFGYTGRIVLVVDDEDKTLEAYQKAFGAENVAVFQKSAAKAATDSYDNSPRADSVVYARNVCFDVAERMGITDFVQLDDDYYWFGHRTPEKAIPTRRLDDIFQMLVEFMDSNEKILSVAFAQGGDHLGGYDITKPIQRKAMNSFVCKTTRRFEFFGRMNDDVNTYVRLGAVGNLFFTIPQIQLDQKDTQTNSGGLTDMYRFFGTYTKSFYTVMQSPSCVKVRLMRCSHPRLHHGINWNTTVPKIIHKKHKKP